MTVRRDVHGSGVRRDVTVVALFALFASLLSTPVVADEGSVDLAVMNGEEASIEDLPWVVLIQHPGGEQGSMCTGSVIAPSWVLTAAHCVEYEDGSGSYREVSAGDLEVFLGMDDFSVGPVERVRATRTEIHPEWFSSGRRSSDIALIELEQPTATPPVPLVGVDYVEVPDERAVVSGWGQLRHGENTDRLMRGDVPILEDQLCAWTYGFTQYQGDRMICAGGEGVDACPGDSGGPLVLPTGEGFAQIGITSAGDLCTDESLTRGIYTSVAFHRTWMDELVTDLAPAPELEQPAAPEPEEEPDPEPIEEPVEDPEPIEEPAEDPEPLPDPLEESDPVEEPEPSPDPVEFPDVPAGHVHEPGILAVAAAGITTGYADGSFGLNDDVLRGQLATFLYRAVPDRLSDPGVGGFSDVPLAHVHAPGIRAVAAGGITTGYADGRFGISDQVTRGQMATFLYRALHDELTDPGSGGFPDVPADNVHAPGIRAVAAAGITSGYADGRFGINDPVSRGQMATFLYRAGLTEVATAE